VSDSADPQTAEATAVPTEKDRSLEASVKALWESARRAAETIARLREEKRDLQSQLNRLEREILTLRQENGQLKKHGIDRSSDGALVAAGAERDRLAARVKELIAKLDAYL
jgi:predicted RNase H-like nuclease (RuvC/YqgF family)